MVKVIKNVTEHFMRMTVAFGIFGGAFAAGAPTPATAEVSYPWCVQGSVLHCYYMTREQCEMTVDYHGFCVANPDVLSQGSDPKTGAAIR